jgi:hypothetical protein
MSDVLKLALMLHKYFILPTIDGNPMLFCGISLHKECGFFIISHWKRSKDNATTAETCCHQNAAVRVGRM